VTRSRATPRSISRSERAGAKRASILSRKSQPSRASSFLPAWASANVCRNVWRTFSRASGRERGSPRRNSLCSMLARTARTGPWSDTIQWGRADGRLDRVHTNVSEGRRGDVVAALAEAAVKAAPGVVLLDRTSDADHNRSVLTFLGEGEALRRRDDGARRGRSRIDRPPEARGRPSAPRRRRRDPVRSRARRHDGGLRGPREDAREDARRPLWTAGVSLRRRGLPPGAPEPREHPQGRVRGPRVEDVGSGLEAGFRSERPAPVRRRVRGGRSRPSHRLQHQPRDRRSRGRGPQSRRRSGTSPAAIAT